jgi:hypothetical protein
LSGGFAREGKSLFVNLRIDGPRPSFFFFFFDLRFCGLDGIQSSRAEEDSTVAIGFKVNTNVVFFGFMMEMLDTGGDTRDRDFL